MFYAAYVSNLGGGGGGGGGGGPFLPLAGGTMSGVIDMGGHDIVNGGRVGQGVTVHTLTDGETYIIGNQYATVVYVANTEVATQTTDMQPNPINGQTMTLNCFSGGIAAWTLQTTDGSQIVPAPPTFFLPGQTFEYTYVALASGYWILTSHVLQGVVTQPLLFEPDNTIDIGSPDGGTTLERPRTIYVGSSIDVNTATGFDSGTYTVNVAGLQLQYSGDSNNSFINSGSSASGDSGGYLFVGATPGMMNAGKVIASSNAFGTVFNGSDPQLWVSGPAGAPTSRGLYASVGTAERTGMTDPPPGLIIFDSDIKKLFFWNGTAWEMVTSV